ncbi:MAG: two-component regulator propeller domain-containing protein, partial [Bacteroidota bacterium]
NSGLPYERVECLALDTSGNLWLGNFDNSNYTSAIVKFDGTNWTVDSTNMLQFITHLDIDGNNRFFAGTESEGFSQYDGASFTKITTSNSGLSLGGGHELSIDDQQEVRAINDQGYTHYDRQVWTNYDTASSQLLNTGVLGVVQDHTGNTWIGTNEGVIKYDGSTWTRWDTSNSALTNQYVNAITVDPDNAIWIGTNFAPFKFDGTNWIDYFSNAGSNISDVFVTDDGDVWMGSPGYGLNRFDRISTWTIYTPVSGGNFQAGALDKNGNVWYGGNGLNKWDGASWTMYTTADGLPWNFVTALAVDTNNILWIGTQLGLSKYDGTTFTNYLKQNSGLTGNYIGDIEVDAFNNKWIGTGSGISVFNEDGVVLNIPRQENSQESNLRFYPNPATNVISIDLLNPAAKRMVLTIVDVIGNELQQVEISKNSTKIDISKLESGVYFGMVTTDAGLISKGKFVIQ